MNLSANSEKKIKPFEWKYEYIDVRENEDEPIELDDINAWFENEEETEEEKQKRLKKEELLRELNEGRKTKINEWWCKIEVEKVRKEEPFTIKELYTLWKIGILTAKEYIEYEKEYNEKEQIESIRQIKSMVKQIVEYLKIDGMEKNNE